MMPPQRDSLTDKRSAHGRDWQRLNQWMAMFQEFWREAPFKVPRPEWIANHSALANWVQSLSNEQCEDYERNIVSLIRDVAVFIPEVSELEGWIEFALMHEQTKDLLPCSDPYTLDESEAVGMPGRKRLQAGAIAAALLPLNRPMLDWCCGKGHLARTLSRASGGRPVIGYEWDGTLVADGNRLAADYNDPVELSHQDVMAHDLQIPGDRHVVALHACGDLHRQLLRQGAAQGSFRLSIAPCCFHLTRVREYQPMSALAQNDEACLCLSAEDLRLAVQETVTAPRRVQVQTRQLQIWRLGFDALQRALRDVDGYLPVPPLPGAASITNFEAFCRWAAGKKSLRLPDSIDFDGWEARGVQRAREVQRYELIRHLFRRPLELWLVLDYACFLEENGYDVSVRAFCERALTPRNLLIDAQKKAPEGAFVA